MPKIDDNNTYLSLAGVEGSTSTEQLKVDPVTGALLVEIHSVTSSTPTLPDGDFDDNNSSVSFAFNGTNRVPLLIDNRNGYLWFDVA